MNKLSMVVFKKEIKDMLRDKKALITGLLIPLLLFPILSMVLGKSMNSTKNAVNDNLQIAIVDSANSRLSQYLKAQKNLKIVDSKNPEEDVKAGKLLVSINVPDNFDANLSNETIAGIKLYYDNTSQKSDMAMSMVKSSIEEYSKTIVSKRLSDRKIDAKILTPVNIETKSFEKEENGIGKMMLSMMLPLLLLLYCAQGPLAAATDLGAGEKERGTLEPLLSTKANRGSLLRGKLFAITFMGILVSVASMIGMYLALIQKNGIFSGGGDGGASITIDITAIILIGIIAILTTMSFGAFELSISLYARSFKEAQTYLMPFVLIPMIAAYGVYMLDAKNIATYFFSIPLINVTCSIKELSSGIYNMTHLGLTMGWSLVYIVIAIQLAKYLFSREEVIFRS